MATQRPASTPRSHIIERPRLLKLLDEAAESARVILLVAPAGYGKTTLARQWAAHASKRTFWHHARWPSVDSAEVASAIAVAVANVRPRAATRLTRLLRSGQALPAFALANALAEALQPWPDDAWLVLDDYHLTTASDDTRAILRSIADGGAVQLLITSRERPDWTAERDIVYGDIRELTSDDLRMTPGETRAVFRNRRSDVNKFGLRAEGWPAVVGLAAYAADLALDPQAQRESLYRYFAEELFARLDPEMQDRLVQVALVPEADRQIIDSMLTRPHTDALLDRAKQLGFVVETAGDCFELHPLLREFLLSTIQREDCKQRIAQPVIDALLAKARWDAAFEVISRVGQRNAYPRLIDGGLDTMLTAGRVTTLKEWLAAAERSHARSPLIDIARAEVAYRDGRYREARIFAQAAASALDATDPRASRAYIVAARGARFDGNLELAFTLYARAVATARTPADRREASWGRYLNAQDLEHDQLEQLAVAYRTLPRDQLEDEIRARTQILHLSLINGGVDKAIGLDANALLTDMEADPLVLSAYMKTLAYCLLLNARYDDVIAVTRRVRSYARRYQVGFAVGHIDHIRAAAAIGVRRFGDADRILRNSWRIAEEQRDANLLTNLETLRLRLSLAQGRFASRPPHELATVAPWHAAHRAELWATAALAHAAHGYVAQAEELVAMAAPASRAVEVTTSVAAARAAIALRTDAPDAVELAHEAWRAVVGSGAADIAVHACRAVPELVATISSHPPLRDYAYALLTRSRDRRLAMIVGSAPRPARAPTTRSLQDLSARELEVLELVACGLTNKQIARSLVVEEATVKMHLRHIFEKLGVRSRTAAALRLREDDHGGA